MKKNSVFVVFPTLLTLANLFTGFTGIFLLLEAEEVLAAGWDPVLLAAWGVFLALGFDAVDGHVARITRRAGSFGLELDSLADLVSFGVLPACLIVQDTLAQGAAPGRPASLLAWHFNLLLGGIFLAGVALRLARFNVEHLANTQRAAGHGAFAGLPSPSAAGLLAALFILDRHLAADPGQIGGPALAAPFLSPVLALLMISRVRYAHLGDRVLGQRENVDALPLVVILVLTAVTLYWLTPLLVLGGYTASGPLGHLRQWLSGGIRPQPAPGRTPDGAAPGPPGA